MRALAIGAIVFACVFGGALLGFWLRTVLPQEHLNSESQDLVRLGMGTIATMSALVLGLLVASAKSSYDAESLGLTQMAAKVVLLDRMLAHYGPEAAEARALLKVAMAGMIERIRPGPGSHPEALAPSGSPGDRMYDKIEQLAPKDDLHRELQRRIIIIATEIVETRLLTIEEGDNPVPLPLIIVVAFSVALTFTSFALQAPPNGTIVVTFLLAALAVSAVMFLILGMYTPFGGLIPVSNGPLRWALGHLADSVST
jgi:hypothetical protein